MTEDAIPVAIPSEGGKKVTKLTVETEDGTVYEYTNRVEKRTHTSRQDFVYFENETVRDADD